VVVVVDSAAAVVQEVTVEDITAAAVGSDTVGIGN
jgi:hypothetical protein